MQERPARPGARAVADVGPTMVCAPLSGCEEGDADLRERPSMPQARWFNDSLPSKECSKVVLCAGSGRVKGTELLQKKQDKPKSEGGRQLTMALAHRGRVTRVRVSVSMMVRPGRPIPHLRFPLSFFSDTIPIGSTHHLSMIARSREREWGSGKREGGPYVGMLRSARSKPALIAVAELKCVAAPSACLARTPELLTGHSSAHGRHVR